jgi:predicted acetyltransferase
MALEISEARIEDKTLIRHLMELYRYDFSEYDESDVDINGYFGYRWLDHYWTDEDRQPFIIRVHGKPAGFVLVNQHTYLPGSDWAIAEFFVMRKYRGKGIGKKAAFDVFDRFPGKWEVYELESNQPSQQFWRKVISDYTHGHYSETNVDDERKRGPIQSFENIK